MSHGKERTENNCLNCNAVVGGRFCQICGQENIEPKENFWALVTHFIYDITHFDGKFFSTLKYLLFKPGFLSYEYMRGRRASYLNPIRMYVFTSAIFFVIFFSFVKPNPEDEVENKASETSVTNQSIRIDSTYSKDDSVVEAPKIALFSSDNLPATKAAYDSAQTKLKPEVRDGWFKQLMKHKLIDINEKFKHDDSKAVQKALLEKFLHLVPQMMFISLPFAALILQLLYVRRKGFYYVDHVIFTVHLYIAVYIILLFNYLFNYLEKITGYGVFNWLGSFAILALFFYIYKAMRNFYQQRRGKTILKFVLLNFTYSILLSVLIAIFFITSLFQI